MDYGQYYQYGGAYPNYSGRLNQLMAEQQQMQQGQPQGNYNPYNQPQPMQQSSSNQIRQQPFECRPVTAIEEVRAIQPDFSGRPIFFWNAASNEIYIKQLDLNTGSSVVKTFSLVVPAPAPIATQDTTVPQVSQAVEYVSKDEFEGFKEQITSTIGGLKNELVLNRPAETVEKIPKQPIIPASAPSAMKKE